MVVKSAGRCVEHIANALCHRVERWPLDRRRRAEAPRRAWRRGPILGGRSSSSPTRRRGATARAQASAPPAPSAGCSSGSGGRTVPARPREAAKKSAKDSTRPRRERRKGPWKNTGTLWFDALGQGDREQTLDVLWAEIQADERLRARGRSARRRARARSCRSLRSEVIRVQRRGSGIVGQLDRSRHRLPPGRSVGGRPKLCGSRCCSRCLLRRRKGHGVLESRPAEPARPALEPARPALEPARPALEPARRALEPRATGGVEPAGQKKKKPRATGGAEPAGQKKKKPRAAGGTEPAGQTEEEAALHRRREANRRRPSTPRAKRAVKQTTQRRAATAPRARSKTAPEPTASNEAAGHPSSPAAQELAEIDHFLARGRVRPWSPSIWNGKHASTLTGTVLLLELTEPELVGWAQRGARATTSPRSSRWSRRARPGRVPRSGRHQLDEKFLDLMLDDLAAEAGKLQDTLRAAVVRRLVASTVEARGRVCCKRCVEGLLRPDHSAADAPEDDDVAVARGGECVGRFRRLFKAVYEHARWAYRRHAALFPSGEHVEPHFSMCPSFGPPHAFPIGHAIAGMTKFHEDGSSEVRLILEIAKFDWPTYRRAAVRAHARMRRSCISRAGDATSPQARRGAGGRLFGGLDGLGRDRVAPARVRATGTEAGGCGISARLGRRG